jgi:hypothetical protein
MNLQETQTYSLILSGSLDEDFLSAYCPEGAVLTQCGSQTRLDNLQTDQSGILGILRALHNLGILVLQMNTSAERKSS